MYLGVVKIAETAEYNGLPSQALFHWRRNHGGGGGGGGGTRTRPPCQTIHGQAPCFVNTNVDDIDTCQPPSLVVFTFKLFMTNIVSFVNMNFLNKKFWLVFRGSTHCIFIALIYP